MMDLSADILQLRVVFFKGFRFIILLFDIQDVEGDTPLHDAIAAGNDKAVELLLAVPSIDLTLRNNKDFNLLIFAAFKGNDKYVLECEVLYFYQCV